MPKFLEDKLHASALRRGFSGARADRYTFGAMQNLGFMRGPNETPAGRIAQMRHQHDQDLQTAVRSRIRRMTGQTTK
jgi:hypothetical protein